MSDVAKPGVIFMGPLPPPHMGPTLATEVLLNSALCEDFDLIHLDTSDHRPLSTLGVIDFTNVYLGLKSYCQLIWLILTHRPRAVYIPISQATVGYLRDAGYIVISKLLFRRVICHLRGGNFQRWLAGSSSLTRAFVRSVHPLVDRQIVLGECLRPLFHPYLPDSKIDVVPNGKDIELPHRSRSDDSVTRCLFLANMRRTKGVMDVLDAIPSVLDRLKQSASTGSVEFHFAGAWNEPDLQKEIESYLAEHADYPITWVGAIQGRAKYQLLVDSDIFVFPTYYPPEGHPWAIIEAMAAGLPIISCDQGAVKESVIDGENGYIVEQRNIDEIVERVVSLTQDGQLRRSMGERSRELYEANFTAQRMVGRMRDCFAAAIS